MVFSYYRESSEQPQESTLWDGFLWLTLIEFRFFIRRQIFFTFLHWSVFLWCVLKRGRCKQPYSVLSCTPVKWNAIPSLFLFPLRCSGGYIARNQPCFLRNVNDTNQSLVCRPHTEPWKFWESNNREATAKDQREHLGGTAVRTAAWSSISL